MACPRCGSDTDLGRNGWCKPCEIAYDTWVRRHASDIIWSALGGGLVLGAIGLGLPLLGLGMPVAFGAAFAGVGTMLAAFRLVQRHRRRQFLAGVALPRAYLPSAK